MGVVCVVKKLTEKTTSLKTGSNGTLKVGLIVAMVNEEKHYPKIERTPFRMIVDRRARGSMQSSNLQRCNGRCGCLREDTEEAKV